MAIDIEYRRGTNPRNMVIDGYYLVETRVSNNGFKTYDCMRGPMICTDIDSQGRPEFTLFKSIDQGKDVTQTFVGKNSFYTPRPGLAVKVIIHGQLGFILEDPDVYNEKE